MWEIKKYLLYSRIYTMHETRWGKESISESEFFWIGEIIPAFWQRLDLLKSE